MTGDNLPHFIYNCIGQLNGSFYWEIPSAKSSLGISFTILLQNTSKHSTQSWGQLTALKLISDPFTSWYDLLWTGPQCLWTFTSSIHCPAVCSNILFVCWVLWSPSSHNHIIHSKSAICWIMFWIIIRCNS